MNDSPSMNQVFIMKLTEIVLANITDEEFSVEELAKEVGMSRTSLYRRLKSIKNQNVSKFIQEIRLQQAMEMLQNNQGTVAEISFMVGFGSPAYFNKCFSKYYGSPPGEIKRKESLALVDNQTNEMSILSCQDQKLKSFHKMVNGRGISRYKNPLIIFASILIILVLIWFFSDSILNKSFEKSIVILPFKNLSDDPGNQYFADGVLEDILNNLSQIRELRVISRTTAEQFRETTLTIPEIGSKLKVNYVLEGSVQKYSNKIRINVQLIDALHDQHLWSGKYDREITDIFAVQSDIAIQIGNNMLSKLSPEEIEQLRKAPTKSLEAHNLYLFGRFFLRLRTEDGLKKSIEYFEKAIALDPDYALAWAGLADAYYIQTWYGWNHNKEGWAKAKESALRAININNNLAEAHTVLGSILTYNEYKWEEAEKELLLAIELNPNYAVAHQYYSELMDILRQNDKARKHINIALELDPLFFLLHNESAYYYYNEGKMNESLDECRKVLELNPDFNNNYLLFQIYIKQGEDLKAVETLQKILLLDTLTAKNANLVNNVYERSGMNGIFDWLTESELKNPEPNAHSLAVLYSMMDKKDEALNWLEKAFENRTYSWIVSINNNPKFENLRSEPRFQAILKNMGLSDYK